MNNVLKKGKKEENEYSPKNHDVAWWNLLKLIIHAKYTHRHIHITEEGGL